MDFYSEHKLKNESRFVKKLWCMDNSSQETSIEGLKILPNGCFNIALVVGEGALITFKTNRYHPTQGIYLCAQVTQPVELTLLGNTKVILIQLYPWYFSYYPENDLNNFIDDMSFSETSDVLFNKMINLNSPRILEDTLELTEKHFSDFTQRYLNHNVIEEIASEILLQKGDCKISDIVSQYDFSERWIQVQFKKATGLTLKQFAKIIQFRDSVDKVTTGSSDESLTAIGYEAGFNDQSHFIKNFRHFSGTTPSRFNPANFVLSFVE